jgi:hypothetical protein
MAVTIQSRRGTLSNWTTVNPILADGEIGIDLTSLRLKVGNGTSTWNQLDYSFAKIFFGSNAPASNLGFKNDVYIDSLTGLIYNKTNDTTWAAGTSIAGNYVNLSDVGVTVASLSGGKIPDTQIPDGIARDSEVTTALSSYVPNSQKGVASGVATLDTNGTIPDTQIPAAIARDSEVTTAINNLSSTLTTSIGNVATDLSTNYVPNTAKGTANGVATLGSDGKLTAGQIPAISIVDTHVVASLAAQNALTVQKGDFVIRTDEGKSYIYDGTAYQEILTPGGGGGSALITYQAWSPTIGGSFSLGNGSVSTRYTKSGQFVQANLRISCGSTTNLGTGLTFTMPTTPVGTVNMYGAITNNKVGYPLTKFAETSGVVTVAGEEKKISYSDLTSIGTYQDLASSFVRYGRITGNSFHTPLKNNGLLLTNQYATINLTFTYEG